MEKNFTLITGLLLYFWSFQALGQAAHRCAEGHKQQVARLAVTTASQQRLMNKYDVNFYKLDVELERTSNYIQGSGLIQAKSKVTALDTFAFELHQNLTIDSLVLNGQNHTFTRQAGMVYVPLTIAIPNGNALAARIFYKGTPPAGGLPTAGLGLANAAVPTWGSQVTWSVSQPFAAYLWFPCKQILTDKADSSEVWITTSATNKAGSNGVLKNTTSLPNGKKRYEWKSRYPIAYYLISVAVSDYQEYTIFANPAGAPNPIPIQNYIYGNPAALTNYQADINNTAPLLVKFSELFGLYPFYKEKYGHCTAPIFGGMEHQTMSTMGLFDLWLTAHELGHQWFGDHVTCGSWRDIWLNEGLATYCEYLAFEHLNPSQKRTTMDFFHSPVLAQPGGSLYVPAADSMNVNRVFDNTLSYYKGAAVMHMLRFELNNDSLFFAVLKTYQNLYANSTARTHDFKQVAESVSGKNLTTFFNQWVYGEGHPAFAVAWNQIGQNLIFRVTQNVSRPTITSFFQTDMEYRILTNQGDTIIRVSQNQPVQFYTLPVRGQVSSIFVDPNQWILNRPGGTSRDFNLVTGLPEISAKSPVVLYPNPAREMIRYSGLDFKPEKVRILDATGRLIKQEDAKKLTGNQVGLQGLPAGIYLLQLEGKEQVISRSFRKD